MYIIYMYIYIYTHTHMYIYMYTYLVCRSADLWDFFLRVQNIFCALASVRQTAKVLVASTNWAI